jgi:hypothetical protein
VCGKLPPLKPDRDSGDDDQEQEAAWVALQNSAPVVGSEKRACGEAVEAAEHDEWVELTVVALDQDSEDQSHRDDCPEGPGEPVPGEKEHQEGPDKVELLFYG